MTFAYTLVSTKNGQTLDNQRQALIEAIGRRQGWVIADEFPDERISGAKGRDKRPEFDREANRRVIAKLMIAPLIRGALREPFRCGSDFLKIIFR